MKRLNFLLPEWTRVQWASAAARSVWEPRVNRISTAWETVERAAVVRGSKPSCLQNVSPEKLSEAVTWAAQNGIIALPLCQVGASASYSATSKPVGSGPWVYRVAFTRSDLAADWGAAWAKGDDAAIGRLLGFPPCCQAFFQKRWVDERMVDLTWPAATGGDDADRQRVDLTEVEPEANILGRWIGVRLVSHMPCSFHCRASAEIGRQMLAVFRDVDPEAAAWCREILSWPAQWSALHGISEITWPVFKVSTRTDATPVEYVVRVQSDTYPAEGASGTRFPFRAQPQVIPLTSLRAYTKAFENESAWRDNGFGDRASMEAAHRVVAAVAPKGSVLDLGCGNGRLARRIAGADYAAGVDVKKPTTHELDEFITANIAVVDAWKHIAVDTTIIMPGRLLEMSTDDAEAVRAALCGRKVIVYAYGDWLQRYTLRALCGDAGLDFTILKSHETALAAGVTAALIEVN